MLLKITGRHTAVAGVLSALIVVSLLVMVVTIQPFDTAELGKLPKVNQGDTSGKQRDYERTKVELAAPSGNAVVMVPEIAVLGSDHGYQRLWAHPANTDLFNRPPPRI